ncbi:hypothetical protein GOV12_04825 [Candidatus Pacearchaeota archaeon]|nr:hypothetical protein [Candidatus Pacearchaeota archaeon]
MVKKKKVISGRFIHYRKDISKVRIVHNKILFIIIIVLLLVLAGLLWYSNHLIKKAEINNQSNINQKCIVDSDCIDYNCNVSECSCINGECRES